jgi:acetylornithine/N-succinyldiaminopimelate aminotransferase
MAVGNAMFDELVKPKFLEHVNAISNQLGQSLEGIKDRHPDLVADVRGKGLLRGLKLTFDPKLAQAKLRERKVLVGVAGENVLRLAPPLIIDEAQVAHAIDAIDASLSAHKAGA